MAERVMSGPRQSGGPLAELRRMGRDVLRYRELLAELARRDLRIRYKQAVMGVLWAVLMPLVVALSGWILRLAFSYMAGAKPVPADLAAIAVKALGWSFFIGALSFGTASITANLALVTKVYFPRVVLPLSTVVTQIVDSAVGAVALLVVLPFLGVRWSAAFGWIPLLAVLLILVTIGVTLVASCANVFFRDARHIVQVVMSFGIFFTPVFFNADAFGPKGVPILMLNPIGPVLEGIRLVVVDGHNLAVPITNAAGALTWSPWFLASTAGWAVVGTAVAAVVFQRVEFAFADYI
jgi:ABC-type polysaccharide/polyol phosphate export permease